MDSGPSPGRIAVTGLRRIPPFAGSRPGPQGIDPKPTFPHARAAIGIVSSILHPSARCPIALCYVFAVVAA
jgi:hypothetical protein